VAGQPVAQPACHTLRGMHFQAPPDAETKLVRAVRGRAYDVVIDLRPDSPRYRDRIAVELDAEAMNAVFIPRGCAHGFLTLRPDTDVLYQISPLYVPGKGRGVRWNDAAFAIRWPADPAGLGGCGRRSVTRRGPVKVLRIFV
jgi:dTDP-4-dehydrorhamnose 3,5-epimerase